MPSRARDGLLWFLVGLFALCVATLSEVSRLIGAIESAGQRSYDAGVFTSFRPQFWNTEALSAAMSLWRATQYGTPSFDVKGLLSWHLAIDALLFVPAYCALIWYVLKHVGASKRVAWSIAGATAAADWLETSITGYFFILRDLKPSSVIWIVPALSFIKWAAIAGALTTIAALWNHQRITDSRTHPLALRRHGALASVTLIVIVFAAVVALPAGGPLDQIPDVLRAQLSPDVSWTTRVLSAVALALLAASVATGAALAADPRASGVPRTLMKNRAVLLIAAAVSATLLLVCFVREHALRISALAPAIVMGAIWAASKLATLVGASDRDREPHDARPTPMDAAAGARHASALAGAIVIAGGIGLVRAAFPAWVLALPAGVLPWWLVSLGAATMVLAGGFVAQLMVVPLLGLTSVGDEHVAGRASRRRRVIGVPTAVLTIAFAVWLTVDADHAKLVSTTGVIAIGFGTLALCVGWLAWVARERVAWEATQTLGIGIRTPWLGILSAVWFLSSLLNTDGIYHDARVVQTSAPIAPRYPTLDSAFSAWFSEQHDSACASASKEVPLILVAAPGGGIRAAYWTAATLDSLFGGRGSGCITTPIFAMSGVSGGSVGITTWIAATAAGDKGESAAAGLSGDDALASAAAGLFFRDAVQPLIPLAVSWRDRAALLEDGWERGKNSPLRGVRWNTLGTGLPWVPVIVLNGSSVNDGCRVLVANVAGLPTEIDHGCSEAPHAGVASGPVTNAIDGIAALRARADTSCATGVQLRAATAALLSARFPVVSSSGALIRCRLGAPVSRRVADSLRTTTYVVDGGYFENSGILTLLQLWRQIEPLVQQKNALVAARRIVPWMVVIDNHYRSAASVRTPQRPLELVVPIKTLTSGSVTSQAALEQMAWGEIAGSGEHCASGESADTLSGATPEAPHGCVVTIAPAVSPGVTAPLGWVLSDMSRKNMDSQIKQRFSQNGAGVDVRLTKLLSLIARPKGQSPSNSNR